MINVISFSLYGDLPLYCEGALANVELAKIHYPGWVCRFYVDHTAPHTVVDRLAAAGGEIVMVTKPSLGATYGRYWRFWVAADQQVDRFVVRDVDSRLNPREKAAVDAWVASERRFHIMRDGPWHVSRVLAGMWGGIGGSFPDMAELIDARGQFDEWGQNDRFASDVLFPLMGGDYLCHNDAAPFDDGEPFPPHAPLDGTCHVGEVVQPGAEIDVWLEYGNALKKYHQEVARVTFELGLRTAETDRGDQEFSRANRETERADAAEGRLAVEMTRRNAAEERLAAETARGDAAEERLRLAIEMKGRVEEELRRELERECRAREQLEVELADCRRERQAILSSTSWRLTAPLRAIGQFLSRRR